MQKFHVNKERNPRTVFQYSPGIIIYFHSDKAIRDYSQMILEAQEKKAINIARNMLAIGRC